MRVRIFIRQHSGKIECSTGQLELKKGTDIGDTKRTIKKILITKTFVS